MKFKIDKGEVLAAIVIFVLVLIILSLGSG